MSVSAKRLMPSAIFSLVLVFGVGLGVVLVQKNQNLSKKAAGMTAPLSCDQISFSPNKDTYRPGETVNLTVKGGVGAISDIKVRWVPSPGNITTPADWKELPGTYNLSTGQWNGSLVAPANGDYVVFAEVITQDKRVCSGNPGYTCTDCVAGTYYQEGITTPGKQACQGCYRNLSVSSAVTGKYDMQQYWNYSPGFYWQYDGMNYNHNLSFKTRVSVEEKVKACGHELLPLRTTKDKKEGYILVNLPLNFRKFVTYFESGERWSEETMGKLFNKHYRLNTNSSNPLAELGPETFDSDISIIASYAANAPFENAYYAPHPFTERYIKDGWNLTMIEKLYRAEFLDPVSGKFLKFKDDPCNLVYSPSAGRRLINHTVIGLEDVDTPAYKGKALRLRFTEQGYPTGWKLREDWYLAEGIGRVQIDKKALNNRCPQDPDCEGLGRMANPDMTIKLNNYYIGGPLQVSRTSTSDGSLAFKVGATGGNYNGYLEVRKCEGTKGLCKQENKFTLSQWVTDGAFSVDPAIEAGFGGEDYRLYFRPKIDATPADAKGEEVAFYTQLPWSNTVNVGGSNLNPASGTNCTVLSPLCGKYGGLFCEMAKNRECR